MAFKDGGSVGNVTPGPGTLAAKDARIAGTGAPAPSNPQSGADPKYSGQWQPTIPQSAGAAAPGRQAYPAAVGSGGPLQAPNGAASDELTGLGALELPRPAGLEPPPAPGSPGGGTATHDGVSNRDPSPNHGYMPGRSVPVDSNMNDPRRAGERAQGGPNVGAHGPNQPTNAPKSQDPAFGKTAPKGGAKFPTGRPAFQPGRKGK